MDGVQDNQAVPTRVIPLTDTQNSIRPPVTQKILLTFRKGINHLTLEPRLFLKMLAEGNIVVVASALQTERVCRVNLNFTQQDCLDMDKGNHSIVQEKVQVYQNTFNYYQSLMDCILPMMVILLAGSISDRYGRKLPMATVIVGFVAFALIYTLAAINPSWPVEVLYTATLAVDITGTWAVFNMAVYSYLSDITPIESRTKRMAWMDAIWYSGGPIGTWMGGLLYQSFGYVCVFSVSAALWLICLFYVVFIVQESLEPVESESKENPFASCRGMMSNVFQRYLHRGRLHLMALISIKLGVFFIQGHQVYLWARRVLSWNAIQYSYWIGTNDAVHQIGMIIWIGIGSAEHLTDFTIATMGMVSIGLWSVFLACITDPSQWWLTIIATLIGAFKAGIEPALRTLITSIPDKKNVGKVFAFLGLLESIGMVVDKTIYTYLYNTFVESFPQINFVVASLITIVLILALTIVRRDWPKVGRSSSTT